MAETEGAADMQHVVHTGAREEQEDSGGGGNSEFQPLGVDAHASTSSDRVISSQQAGARNPESNSSSESTATRTDTLQPTLLDDTSSAQSQAQQQQRQHALVQQKDLELRQLQKTHDEYVKSSCEYEKELEHEMELCERKVVLLEQRTRSMETINDVVSKKLAEVQAQLASTHSREQLLLKELEEMKWKVQQLEQANDELETAARIAQASIEDLEHKNEFLLEQNVFLQQEKEELGLRQMVAGVPIAEAQVHPAPASVCNNSSSFNSSSSSSSFSRSLATGAHNSEKTPAATTTTTPASQHVEAQQNLRGKNKVKGRYPDVVESCIHITCRKCRPSHHSHNHHNHHSRHSRAHRSSSAVTSSFEHKGAEGGKKKVPGMFEKLRLRFRAIFDCSSSSSSPTDGK